MPYEQKNNPFKKLMSNITSGLNIKAPNVKKEMDWKYGHGEFADIKKRRKPGESKFQYDVRMREKASRRAVKTDMEKGALEQEITDTSDLTREQRLALGEKLYPETNPNDLTDKSQVQNFGIIAGMSFGEAFKQAGKTAKRGDIFMWNDQPFIYDFENKEEKKEDKTDIDIDIDNIPDEIQGTTRYHKKELDPELYPEYKHNIKKENKKKKDWDYSSGRYNYMKY